jgi:hypothetical protein
MRDVDGMRHRTIYKSLVQATSARLPAHLIAHLITMGQLHRDNRYDRMTDSFQQLVGRAPIAAAEFARRYAAAFTSSESETSGRSRSRYE